MKIEDQLSARNKTPGDLSTSRQSTLRAQNNWHRMAIAISWFSSVAPAQLGQSILFAWRVKHLGKPQSKSGLKHPNPAHAQMQCARCAGRRNRRCTSVAGAAPAHSSGGLTEAAAPSRQPTSGHPIAGGLATQGIDRALFQRAGIQTDLDALNRAWLERYFAPVIVRAGAQECCWPSKCRAGFRRSGGCR